MQTSLETGITKLNGDKHSGKILGITYDIGKEMAKNMVHFPKILQNYENTIQMVGCSSAGYQQTVNYLEKLKYEGIQKFYLFPGKISQFIACMKYTSMLKGVIIPRILNSNDIGVHLKVKIGSIIVKTFQNLFHDLQILNIGYIVLNENSTVGKETNCSIRTEDEYLEKIDIFLLNNPKTYGICLENGSGSNSICDSYFIENVKNVISKYEELRGKKYELMIFGGIKAPDQVDYLYNLGATFVGISSILETEHKEISTEILYSFLEVLDLWRFEY